MPADCPVQAAAASATRRFAQATDTRPPSCALITRIETVRCSALDALDDFDDFMRGKMPSRVGSSNAVRNADYCMGVQYL